MAGLHPTDAHLLGFDVSADGRVTEGPLTPELSRPDAKLYGGTGLAWALAAIGTATGRTPLFASVQFVGTAATGEVIRCEADVVAEGRSVSQVQLHARVGERLVFSALGAAGVHTDDGVGGPILTMPTVPPPDACTPRRHGPPGDDDRIGFHRRSEFRDVPSEDPSAMGSDRMWARVTGAQGTTAASLGFLADMVPVSVARGTGQLGAGTSLDNELRVVRLVDTEWVLCDMQPHGAHGGFGYGIAHLWSQDGVLLATGAQTAKLFAFDPELHARFHGGA